MKRAFRALTSAVKAGRREFVLRLEGVERRDVVVINSNHISEEDANRLQGHAILHCHSEFLWMINVVPRVMKLHRECHEGEFTSEFWDLLEWASRRADYLRLDCDGQLIKGMCTYDW